MNSSGTVMLDVTLLILNIANVILHGIGSYLLTCIYRKGERSAQKIFIINLSVCELVMNLMECIRRTIELYKLADSLSHTANEFQHYLLIVIFTGVSFVFYMDMIFLTLDRLLNIILNFKYPIYCNESIAKYLLFVTWIIGAMISLSVIIAHYVIEYTWESFFFKYFYPTLEIAFILLALGTYVVIFRYYRKSLEIQFKNKKYSNNETEDSNVFRISRFFVPILLIASFIIFMLIPDLVYLFYGILGKNESKTLLACCWISYAISNLLDGWIYIFMQKSVKTTLKKKLRRLFGGNLTEMKDNLQIALLSRRWQQDKVNRRKIRYQRKSDSLYHRNAYIENENHGLEESGSLVIRGTKDEAI